MHDIQPTPPSALRRDRKAQAAPGLVAAPPVRSARVAGAGAAGVRGWLLLGAGIAVAIVVALSGTMLATGFGNPELPTLSEAQDLRAIDHLEAAPCALPVAGEANGSVLNIAACEESGDFPDTAADSAKSDLTPTPQASGQPHAPDDARSGPVAPDVPDPGTSTDPTPNPHDPSNPSPDSTPPPDPEGPPPPPPDLVDPPPPPPPPVHEPKSLAFTNLTENHAIGLLGIRLLSSYTLSISGEPGSKATIFYGSRSAGSVTFNSSGRASITLGTSLIGGGGGSTIIRASYSDGTSGNDIQARRDSI